MIQTHTVRCPSRSLVVGHFYSPLDTLEPQMHQRIDCWRPVSGVGPHEIKYKVFVIRGEHSEIHF